MACDIDASEADAIYGEYVAALNASYDKLKGRFNTFAAKCLSEKQKRESGLLLVAPPLQLPGDRETIEQEQRAQSQMVVFPGEEAKQRPEGAGIMMPGRTGVSPMMNRMGAKQGSKMEKFQKKD